MHQLEHFHVSVYNIIVDNILYYNQIRYICTVIISIILNITYIHIIPLLIQQKLKQCYVAHGIALPSLKKLIGQCMEEFTVVFVKNGVQMQGYFPVVAICVLSAMMDVFLHLSNQLQKII